jgi:hypothetical protein
VERKLLLDVTGKVVLVDQFDQRLHREEKAEFLMPTYFCVPVRKTISGWKTGEAPLYPGAHLAIYNILEQTPKTTFDPPVYIRDQFGTQTLAAETVGVMLAVPSRKHKWQKIQDT